jgi:hypothetical protein
MKKSIHLIPTDKPSRLFLKGKTLLLNNQYTLQEVFPKGKCQNIYITSDEEIKEGDYFYSPFQGEERILKYNKFVIPFPKDKKIIITTDEVLIADGVQAIPNDFLEWLVQNPSCQYGGYKDIPWDQIITLKEEPKQEFTTVNGSSGCTITITDEKSNPLTYWGGLKEPKPHSFCETPEEKCTMNYCDENGCQNRKRQLTDLEIAIRLEEIEREERTQETIEEAAERFYSEQSESYENAIEPTFDYSRYLVTGFIDGAKWQAERMYSE